MGAVVSSLEQHSINECIAKFLHSQIQLPNVCIK